MTHLPRLFLLAPILLLAACAGTPPTAVETPAVMPPPSTEEAASAMPPARPAGHFTLAAVGDVMIDASAREIVVREGYDYPFDATRMVLEGADITIANLEGPLTTRGKADPDKRFVFRSPPRKVARALAAAGFDVVSLANNHTLDYGAIGLADTIAALDAVGVRYIGAGANLAAARTPAIIEVGGKRVAFLAYNLTYPENFWATATHAGTAFAHRHHVIADTRAARRKADIVIVSFHWGQEVKTTLRAYQPALGRAAIDAGASLVIGHHPHILQGVEHYRDGVILYSLGNFAFGSYSKRVRTSAIALVDFERGRIARVRMVPLDVYNPRVLFQPQPLTGAAAEAVIDEIQQLSAQRDTTFVSKDGLAVLDLGPARQPEHKPGAVHP